MKKNEQTTSQKIAGVLILLAIVVLAARVITMDSEEEKLLSSLESAETSKDRFEIYKKLLDENPDNKQYVKSAKELGNQYLSTVPSTKPREKLSVLAPLSKISGGSEYRNEIARFKNMDRAMTECRRDAIKDATGMVANPETFEVSRLGGEWKTESDFYTTIEFVAQNDFGVPTKTQAFYHCKVSLDGSYRLARLRIVES